MFVKLFEHEWPKRILHTIIHKIVHFLLTDNFYATGSSYLGLYQKLMYLRSDICYGEPVTSNLYFDMKTILVFSPDPYMCD